MRKLATQKLFVLLTFSVLSISISGKAQEKVKLIGNKPRNGTSNNTSMVIKGNQLGVIMNAGKKNVQLLKLNFDVKNNQETEPRFKVNVYKFNGAIFEENLIKKEVVGVVPKGKNHVTIELSGSNTVIKDKVLVTIEWLETISGSNPSFAIGLFNGGSYTFENGKWKKIPVAGIDFNVLVKELR